MGEKDTATMGAGTAGASPEAAEGIVKSKSNITNNGEEEESAARLHGLPPGVRAAEAGAGGGGTPGPSEATNLNSSRSN